MNYYFFLDDINNYSLKKDDVIIEDNIIKLDRKAIFIILSILRKRPPIRLYIYNPFDKIDYTV